MAARSRLRVLCFGDSLTAGYSRWGLVHHPYREKLDQMLSMAFPDLEVQTVADGLSGDTVTYGFQGRMVKQFSDPVKTSVKTAGENGDEAVGERRAETTDEDDHDGRKRYDWAIVLGGTNDMGMGIPAEEIFEALKRVWHVPLSRGCKVLALTVPEAGVRGFLKEEVDAQRNKLNDLIRGYRRPGFHVYDLHKTVPYWGMSQPDRKRYWDDHIHFTPAGYDLIGNKVGIALVSLLARERGLEPQRPQKRRRVFKDDDKQFEEEVGDPSAIDQGYVVVRRVDLE